MIRLLQAINLLLLAAVLSVILTGLLSERVDSAHWWREAKANEFEWRACETKHTILLKQIKREGLWRRLGMGGAPWLQ